MPPLIPDAPWLANMILSILSIGLTSGVAVWVATIQTRKKLEVVREQVQNSHTENNLRDDIDVLKYGYEELKRDVKMALQYQQLQASQNDDMKEMVTQIQKSLNLRYRLQEKALDEAVNERNQALEALESNIPRIVKSVVHTHMQDCPVRKEHDVEHSRRH